MADFFFSMVNAEALGEMDETTANIHVGTSDTAGDDISLRMDQSAKRYQILKFLKLAERWIKNGGANSAGANLGSP